MNPEKLFKNTVLNSTKHVLKILDVMYKTQQRHRHTRLDRISAFI